MESFDWTYRLARCWSVPFPTRFNISSTLIRWVAGHAIRYAVELGLHKALPRLSRRKNVGGVEGVSESERALLIGARTWCGLYVFGEFSLC